MRTRARYGAVSCLVLALLTSHVQPRPHDEPAPSKAERVSSSSLISSSLILLPSSLPLSSSSIVAREEEAAAFGIGRRGSRPVVMSSLIDKAKGFVADKVAHIPKPEANLTGISIKSLSRDGVLFHSEVSVSNPYSHSLPICEVSYSLKSVDRVIASGTMPDPGSLPANVVTKLELPVKVPYDFLVSLAKDIGRDWDIDYVLDVGLTVDLPIVGNLTIPLSTKGEIKLPTIGDIF